ncbi:phenoloxidase-activating enzyme 1 isoform X2 [Pieris rapae]|uniref:phenoloxidase-activating enzyme 1 isoform X2 n=1 Tax=Pieris rapae TaxID=64459 RepID=UPI001E2819EB|nr:phenoloxidase-activating enzyme 1 isoform X2 [Pieris rapae]
MKCFIVILGLFLIADSAFSDQCTTPLGRTSNCISLYDCPEYLAAFAQRPLSAYTQNFLRKSQCGFDGSIPYVCCGPLPSQTPATPTIRPRPTLPPDADVDPTVREDSFPERRGKCGIERSDRIFGGIIADLDEFPWMALLGYRTKNDKVTYQCGGVLFNHRYVLTAAHCVTGQILTVVGKLERVRLGEYDTQTDLDCLADDCAEPVQEILVQAAYPHSGFSDSDNSRPDDIALVRLTKRARYSDFVSPICLPDYQQPLPPVGDEVLVAGWGKTLEGKSSPVKVKLSIPMFDKRECVNKYATLKAYLRDKQLCAGGIFAKDSCKGDSGGPLMKRTGDIWTSIGVVSFGYGCGRDGWPGVYSSVASYMDWIQDKLQSTNV